MLFSALVNVSEKSVLLENDSPVFITERRTKP